MEADRFVNKYKALGAQLFASGMLVGESQADTIMDLHKLVDWSIKQNHDIDLAVLYDLRSPDPLYLCRMVRDVTGVWMQINAGDDANASAANSSPSEPPTALDERIWGDIFAPGEADHIMNWMSALDRVNGEPA